jgi:hypothetical protein
VIFTITQQLEEGFVVTELVVIECARADYIYMLMGELIDRIEVEFFGVACASFTFDNGDYNSIVNWNILDVCRCSSYFIIIHFNL